MSKGLFDFVLGWTSMVSPLLVTDRNRDNNKGSLDVLRGFQMFLSNSKLPKKHVFLYVTKSIFYPNNLWAFNSLPEFDMWMNTLKDMLLGKPAPLVSTFRRSPEPSYLPWDVP
ncbi:hypothetical protein Hanom_Chr17g01534021 [Helianthus anomalus]